MSALKFISIVRHYRGNLDVASLGLGGKQATPGMVQVIGGLEHCVEIAPKTEGDRLAMIAWLKSPECCALTKGTPGQFSADDMSEMITEAEETRRGELLCERLKLRKDPDAPGRYLTTGGNKTALGMFRTAAAIVIDGK